MQDVLAIALLLREISFGILLIGIFYTFGMFVLGRLFSAISEHGAGHDLDHDVEHDIEKDFDHDVEHDIDHDVDHDIDHSIEHDYDIDYDIDHAIEHELDHDIEHDLDHDVDHDIEHDVDHNIEKDFDSDTDHELDMDIEVPSDHSGFFEAERGAPLGVSIGTGLVSFGFFGSIIYYEGLGIPLIAKVAIHFIGALLVVYSMRAILSKVFVEAGFMIRPKHIVGMEVEAASTVHDDFGEVRAETEMGLRRFHARPFQKGVVFQKGTKLFAVSADEKFIYVDPRKEAISWVQKQSKKIKE